MVLEEFDQYLGQGRLGGFGVAAEAVIGVVHGHQLDGSVDSLEGLLEAAGLAEGDEGVVIAVHDEEGRSLGVGIGDRTCGGQQGGLTTDQVLDQLPATEVERIGGRPHAHPDPENQG